MPEATWKESIDKKAALLHQQIAAMQRLTAEKPDASHLLEEACAPYYKLLDNLYQEELPLARAIDQSDLLLHLEGRDLEEANPRVALVANVFSDMRKQVSGVIRALMDSVTEPIVLPKEIELRLSSFVRGSLYLGFRLPESTADKKHMAGDPLLAASGEALATIGKIAQEVQTEAQIRRLNETFPDPGIRDAALNAIYHLAPTGRRGVEKMDLLVNALPQRTWSQLTPQTRQVVSTLLAKEVAPHKDGQSQTFTGVIRRIDLDTRRIHLRIEHSTPPKSVRCIYPPALDEEARNWLNRSVELRGEVEFYQNRPSLVHIASVRVIK